MTPPSRLHPIRAVAASGAGAALLVLGTGPAASVAQEPPAADTAAVPWGLGPLVHADRTDDAPELVLYPGGDALVRERVGFDLRAGLNSVSWPDPPDALDPTSLSLTFRDEPAPRVLSSVHRPAAAGIDDALRGLVGTVVTVEVDDGRRVTGTLVSARDALVLDTGGSGADDASPGGDRAAADDGGDMVVLPGRARSYRFPELPETFRTGAEVGWTVRAPERGRREADLAYLSGGLSWDAHYVVELGDGEERADVEARAELENGTDRTFRDAAVKLVAGDVQRAPDGRPQAARLMEAAADRSVDDGGGSAAERAFGELRLLELPRATTLPAGATVRPMLFRADDVPVRKELIVVGGPDRPYRGSGPSLSPDAGAEESTDHARVQYSFSTAEDDGVGHDLPAGLVRVYREDEDGTLLLSGEDRVGDVPRGDSARIETGRSFRVTRTRVQTGFRRTDARTLEEDFRLELRNDREEAVELRVVERMHRWDEWEVLRPRLDGEPAEPRRLDVRTVDWRVSLPAETERELTYTVRYTLPPDPGR